MFYLYIDCMNAMCMNRRLPVSYATCCLGLLGSVEGSMLLQESAAFVNTLLGGILT